MRKRRSVGCDGSTSDVSWGAWDPQAYERLKPPNVENRILREEREILKKSGSLLRFRVSVSERHAFIEVEKANHSVSILCRMLKVSRSGFYDWQRREPSRREQEDEEIILHMRTVHKEAKGRYGQRRMIEALKPLSSR